MEAVGLGELSGIVSGKDDAERDMNYRELVNTMDAFLDTLTPEKRSILISRYRYTDSISEIAGKHRMNDGAVPRVPNRLRLKPHNYLSERGFDL